MQSNSTMGFSGALTLRHTKARRPLGWRIRNLLRPSNLLGHAAVKAARLLYLVTGIPVLTSSLRLLHTSADGVKTDYGVVCRRVVTTAGLTYLRDDFNNAAGGADISLINFHAFGTGAVAEAAGDTALGAECTTVLNPDSTRGVGTRSTPAANQFQTQATLTFDGAAGITEHGLLSAASGGVLWDRSVFAVVNVGAGDTLQGTYVLSLTGS